MSKPHHPKRPRRWVSLDVDYLTRPRIIELRQAFGPPGPLTLLALILECDKTDVGRATDTVEARYGPIAEMVGTAPRIVREIIEKAESLKLLSVEQHHDPVTRREFDRVRLLERPTWTGRQPAHWRTSDAPRRLQPDERVVAVLSAADEPLRATAIADALGLVPGGSFRTRLARMVREGRIVSGKGGYRLAGDH